MENLNFEIKVSEDDVYVNNDLFTFDDSPLDKETRILFAIAKYMGKNPDYLFNI